MKLKVIASKVETALRKLRSNDSFLIQANTNERTISHKIAEYLQEEFPTRNVDCEYNRHGEEIKELEVPRDSINWDDTEAKTVFPDIIIHQRNTDEHNLLVIEVKKSSNARRQFDEIKLMSFTKDPYNYNFGLFLEINMNGPNDRLIWYSDGCAIGKQIIHA